MGSFVVSVGQAGTNGTYKSKECNMPNNIGD
jgi:hypothetical protein